MLAKVQSWRYRKKQTNSNAKRQDESCSNNLLINRFSKLGFSFDPIALIMEQDSKILNVPKRMIVPTLVSSLQVLPENKSLISS